jgi:hypothetical protein
MSTYTSIASQTLSSASSIFTFSNIPQDYVDLVLVFNYKSNSVNQPTLLLSFNGSSTGYSGTQLYGNGSTVGSNKNTNASYISIARAVGTPTTSGATATIIINLMNYANSSRYKTVLARTASTESGTEADVGLWQSASPITSIKLTTPTSNDFAAGSTITLYGIQAGTPKAQGGNIVTTDGTYWYHAFLGSGTFVPNQALTADYLIVAGGGGAMGNISGGGGAGGVRAFTSQSFSANTVYPVLVGAGGTGGGAVYFTPDATEGGNTTFKGTSVTGGGHGQYGAGAAGNGGSGGGIRSNGTYGTGNAGGYSPAEGNNGSGNTNAVHGGGGGGAGAAGGNGPGGAGTQTYNSINFSTWLTATNTGSSSYVAGGGGGTQAFSTGTYSGGIGGGGTGAADNTDGGNGVANTGSGGGGGGYYNGVRPGAGGAGGSGLVIVRYTV